MQYGNAINYGSQADVKASDIAFSIHSDVDSAFYDVEYPDHEWYGIVTTDQVMRGVNPGATTYSYMKRDRHGAAAFVGNGPSNNIPMVGQSVGANEVPLACAAVGALITNEDARQYSFGFNADLARDLGETMREACDNLVESTVIFGNADIGFLPWINYPGITVINAAVGSGGATEWKDKAGEEMVADVNSALNYIWEVTRKVIKPLDVFLPMKQYTLLSQTAVALGGVNLAMTALEFLKKYNIMTDQTGQELRITSSRYLAGAGAGGTDRMVIMDRNRRNQCLPMPMDYNLGQPVTVPLAVEMYAEMKFGSYHVREKYSMLYVDGI